MPECGGNSSRARQASVACAFEQRCQDAGWDPNGEILQMDGVLLVSCFTGLAVEYKSVTCEPGTISARMMRCGRAQLPLPVLALHCEATEVELRVSYPCSLAGGLSKSTASPRGSV